MMQSSNFLLVPRGLSEKSKSTENHPKMEVICISKFSRVSTKIFWKENFEQSEFKSAEFLQKKIAVNAFTGNLNFPLMYPDGHRGIPATRQEEIKKKLCPLMPIGKRTFWSKIAVNNNNKGEE